MDGNSRRFIEGDNVFVFEDNIRGKWVFAGLRRPVRGNFELDTIAGIYAFAGANGLTVAEERGILGGAFNAGTGEMEPLGQDLIAALTVRFFP
jgi:hypothetical protein